MPVKLNTSSVGIALLGIDAVPVEVEVDCADVGLPKQAASFDLPISLGL